MTKQKFKWEDVGEREYLELTTEAMQFHWHESGFWRNPTTGEFVILGNHKWVSEILVNGKWKTVGKSKTAQEAKRTCIRQHSIYNAAAV